MTAGGEEFKIAANPSMDRNSDGSAVLQIARVVNLSHSIHMVADADGPVHTALYFVWGGQQWGALGCRTYDQGVNEGTFLIHFRGDDIEKWEDYQGVIGGDLANLRPPRLFKYKSAVGAYTQGLAGGATGFVTHNNDLALHFYPWNMSEEIFITSGELIPRDKKQPT